MTLECQLLSLEKHIADLKIKVPAKSETVLQIALLKEYFHDQKTLTFEEADPKWKERWRKLYDAQLAIGGLCSAVAELRKSQNAMLSRYLKKIVNGEITQAGPPEEARDLFYELWLASMFSEAGFTVALQEPDIVVEGNGLSQKLGIACKYPSSEQQIHPLLSKGYSQLNKHGLRGFVALGIDQLMIARMELKGMVDFRQSGDPIAVMQPHVTAELEKIVKERPARFPEEEPANELVVTFVLGGLYGSPATFTIATVSAIHNTEGSAIRDDVEKLAASIGKLPSHLKTG